MEEMIRELIVTADYNMTVKTLVMNGKILKSLLGHKDSVIYAVFNNDGSLIVFASYDKTLKICD
jgi:WD40 repeat protein